MTRVLVHNTDGVNPYATEVAALLAEDGADVVLLDAVNGEHRPPSSVRWRRVLPANFGADHPAHQLLRLGRGLTALVRGAVVEDRTIVVAFLRFTVEALLLAVLAALGRRVVVVLHNPTPRVDESGLRRWASRRLVHHATTTVVHADRLREPAIAAGAARVTVCPHPPYHHTAVADPDRSPLLGTDRRWVAFVGHLRWDKGIDLLPDVLARVPEEERRRLGVVICGRGTVEDATWAELRRLGYAVRDLTSDQPVPQELMLQVLAERPLLLAPYVAATQSGTVILALTMGCRVLAFDEGGIPDVLDHDGLVPNGDLEAMARAIAEDRGGRARFELDTWVAETGQRWQEVVADAGAAAAPSTPSAPSAPTPPRRQAVTREMARRIGHRSALGPKLLVRLDRRWRTGRDRRIGPAVGAALAERPDVVSLDVFDTVLTRRLIDAEDVWWAVGAELVRDGGTTAAPDAFATARREVAARRPTASLHELASEPAIAAAFGADVADLEHAAEASLLLPVPGAAEALQRLRDAGVEIVFVSDMHLAPDELWKTLEARELATDLDDLVVSSDVGASKSSGALFEVLEPHRRRVVHLGNDLWSDVAMAAPAGIRGIAVRAAEPTRAEATMRSRPGSVGSAVAAAARLARLGQDPTGPLDAAVIETGAVAGQCFTAFLLWVREQCAREDITDVGFLARDGELPLRMAQALPADHRDGLELHYVEVAARRAWTVAAAASLGIDAWMAVGDADDRAFLHTSRHLVPFGSLLRRVALGPDDLAGHASLAGLDPTKPLPAELAGAWRALLADPAIRAAILERANEQRDLLAEHLRGLRLADRRLALVDVGWRGQLAWMMSAVLRDVTGAEPVHLHFGGANVAAGLEGADIRRFAVDDSVAPLPFPEMVAAVEMFTASGAPRVVGLHRDDAGRVEPIHEPGLPEVANAARTRLWDTAIATAAALPRRADLDRWGLDGRLLPDEVRAVLTEVWTDPEPAHALAAAQLVHEVDDAGTVLGPVAARYRLGEFVGERHVAPRQWREGSLVLTPPAVRVAVRAALALRDRVRG
jgi:glycosyltransferase involved in cell wall biosynthesis/FMN phosphatase YigB (HAD superfamily)